MKNEKERMHPLTGLSVKQKRHEKLSRLPIGEELSIEVAASIVGVTKRVFLREYVNSGHFPLPDWIVPIRRGNSTIAIKRLQ